MTNAESGRALTSNVVFAGATFIAGLMFMGWINKPVEPKAAPVAPAPYVIQVQAAPAAPVVHPVAKPDPVQAAPAKVQKVRKVRKAAPAARVVYVVPSYHGCTCHL